MCVYTLLYFVVSQIANDIKGVPPWLKNSHKSYDQMVNSVTKNSIIMCST